MPSRTEARALLAFRIAFAGIAALLVAAVVIQVGFAGPADHGGTTIRGSQSKLGRTVVAGGGCDRGSVVRRSPGRIRGRVAARRSRLRGDSLVPLCVPQTGQGRPRQITARAG